MAHAYKTLADEEFARVAVEKAARELDEAKRAAQLAYDERVFSDRQRYSELMDQDSDLGVIARMLDTKAVKR